MESFVFKPKYSFSTRINILMFFILLICSVNGKFFSNPNWNFNLTAIMFCIILVLVVCIIGKAKKITIADNIIIDRYLLPPYVFSLAPLIRSNDNIILFNRCSLDTTELRNGDMLIHLLKKLAEEKNITLTIDKPEELEKNWVINWPLIKTVVRISTFVLPYLCYLFLALTFKFTIFSSEWDALIFLFAIFLSWYFIYRIQDQKVFNSSQ